MTPKIKVSPKSKQGSTKFVFPFKFNRFPRYAELDSGLKAIAAAHPNLVTIESIGKSYEGRDIWVLTMTDRSTGQPDEKPAFWADGNIHATELSASVACLYFIQYLLDGFGRDKEITRAMQTRTIYVCPRVNPDGAEWALADSPRLIRSSTRKYPFDYDRIEGYEVRDMDGNGKILRYRIPDANGHWKAHPKDKRVMVRRDPAESGGKYYRIIPEGEFVDQAHFDGTRIKVNGPEQGLDLNRNFPENWRGEAQQFGAGDYPTSEPEVKALVDFFVKHPNVGLLTSFHTFSGVLLRPYGTRPDKDMIPEDLWAFQTIGNKGQELTGYPAIGVYEEFRYHPNEVITGTSDWTYEHLGIYAWVVEIWSPMREAGIKDYKYIDWFREHPAEHDLQMVKWQDREFKGKGFHDWKKFKHPQLGELEVGGWDTVNYISNVPLERLESEVKKFAPWMLWQTLITPQLILRDASVSVVSKDAKSQILKVRLEVQNAGYLPTNVSGQTMKNKVVRSLVANIELSKGMQIVSTAGNSGQSFGALPRVELGQLTGWSHKHPSNSFWPDPNPTSDVAVAEWVVRVPLGTKEAQMIKLSATHQRAGTVRTEVKVPQ